MTFPSKTWTAAVLTVSDMNEYVRDCLNFLKANIALEAPVELTIDAGGEITKTKTYHTVDTLLDALTDNLDIINGGSDGDLLILQANHTDRTVVIRDDVGNIHCGGDIHLDSTHKVVEFIYDAALAEWHPLGAYVRATSFLLNSFVCPNPGTDWTPELKGCALGASKANKKFWIPLDFFKIGDGLVSYKAVGDTTQTNALTLDAKLVRINKVDPITTSDVAGGDIVEVSGTGNFDVEATLTATEIIATDKQYAIELEGTTGVGDGIIVMGIEVTCLRVL